MNKPVPLNPAFRHVRHLSDQPLDAAAVDDEAVDRFAAALKRKLAEARVKGRSGWEDRKRFSATALSDMLLAHVFKGDPCDVANAAGGFQFTSQMPGNENVRYR